jgi:hypothetical protein
VAFPQMLDELTIASKAVVGALHILTASTSLVGDGDLREYLWNV